MTFSQGKEEEILLREVKRLGLDAGRILDVGAYDGVKFSNSRRLILDGWSAVLVEPSKSVYPRLEGLYAGDERVRVTNVLLDPAGTVEGRLVPFWDASGDGTSTTELANRDKWAKADSKFFPSEAFAVSWEGFLKTFPGPYDIVSIDTEGTSSTLLEVMPLEPAIVVVEHDGHFNAVHRAFRARGLREVWRDGNNVIGAK